MANTGTSSSALSNKAARLGYKHQKVQRLRRLFSRRSLREAEGVFVVEGAKLLQEALQSGADIESIFVAPEAVAQSNRTQNTLLNQVIHMAHEKGIRVYVLQPEVMERIADAVTPQPICAIVSISQHDWSAISQPSGARSVIVLVNVRDPGNAGTILRSAEAAGIDAVVFADDCVDVWNPKTVRSSAGSLFHVPVINNVSSTEAVFQLQRAGFECIATAMDADCSYDAVDLTAKTAFFFGNEANGLSEELLGSLEKTIAIPIAGRSESLNVSMAAAIICFEAARQRRLISRSDD